MPLFFYSKPLIKTDTGFTSTTLGSALIYYDRPAALYYGL